MRASPRPGGQPEGMRKSAGACARSGGGVALVAGGGRRHPEANVIPRPIPSCCPGLEPPPPLAPGRLHAAFTQPATASPSPPPQAPPLPLPPSLRSSAAKSAAWACAGSRRSTSCSSRPAFTRSPRPHRACRREGQAAAMRVCTGGAARAGLGRQHHGGSSAARRRGRPSNSSSRPRQGAPVPPGTAPWWPAAPADRPRTAAWGLMEGGARARGSGERRRAADHECQHPPTQPGSHPSPARLPPLPSQAPTPASLPRGGRTWWAAR